MIHNEILHKAVRLLSQLGITANYAGFYQTAYAVSLSLTDPDRLLYITKSIYPDVAAHFQTSTSCIERNIRTVAAVSWKKNSCLLTQLAEHPLTAKPANAEFLAILTTYLLSGKDSII